MSSTHLDPTTGDGIPTLRAAALLRLAVPVPVCAFALLWTLSVAHYYFMNSNPAQRAGFLAPAVRVVEHVLLLPLLTGSNFLAALLFAGGGPARRVLLEQLTLLVAFSLLVRPIYFLATCLGPGGAGEPFRFRTLRGRDGSREGLVAALDAGERQSDAHRLRATIAAVSSCPVLICAANSRSIESPRLGSPVGAFELR